MENFKVRLVRVWFSSKTVRKRSPPGRTKNIYFMESKIIVMIISIMDKKIKIKTKTYLGPCHTSAMEIFFQIVSSKDANYFHNKAPDVWQGPKYIP